MCNFRRITSINKQMKIERYSPQTASTPTNQTDIWTHGVHDQPAIRTHAADRTSLISSFSKPFVFFVKVFSNSIDLVNVVN